MTMAPGSPTASSMEHSRSSSPAEGQASLTSTMQSASTTMMTICACILITTLASSPAFLDLALGTEVKCIAKPIVAEGIAQKITISFDGSSVTAQGVSELSVSFNVQPARSASSTNKDLVSEVSSEADSFVEVEEEAKPTDASDAASALPSPPLNKPDFYPFYYHAGQMDPAMADMSARYMRALHTRPNVPLSSDSTIAPGVNQAAPPEAVPYFGSPRSPSQTESEPPSPTWTPIPSIPIPPPPPVQPFLGHGHFASSFAETMTSAVPPIASQPAQGNFGSNARPRQFGQTGPTIAHNHAQHPRCVRTRNSGRQAPQYYPPPTQMHYGHGQRLGSGFTHGLANAHDGVRNRLSYCYKPPTLSEYARSSIPLATAPTSNANDSLYGTYADYVQRAEARMPSLVSEGTHGNRWTVPPPVSISTTPRQDNMYASASSLGANSTSMLNAAAASYQTSANEGGAGMNGCGYMHFNPSVPGAQYYL